MSNPKRRWTEEEERKLPFLWSLGLPGAARALGRSLHSVQFHATRMGLGSPARGALSLDQAAEYTGYYPRSLMRAAHALGMRLRRCPARDARDLDRRRARFAIDEEQAERLAAWLADQARPTSNRLGPDGPHPACVDCGETGEIHAGRGLCQRCYSRHRRQTTAAPAL